MPQERQAICQNGNVFEFPQFTLDYTAYKYPEDTQVILDEIDRAKKVYAKKDKDLGGIYYYNIPASFDTETTSTYVNGEKVAIMYVWMFSVNGKVIVGRTWSQFEELMGLISEKTDLNNRLLVYIHNMGFDFAFFSRRLKWYKTFCVKVREPIYAITMRGIEFRDSLILTGKSLDASAKDLNKYKVSKLVGNLNYTLVRGSKTPLTKEEMDYCVHDCLVLDAIIQEKIEQEGSIVKIPLTNTGYVRRFLKTKCYPASNRGKRKDKEAQKTYWDYKRLMSKLTLTPDEYRMCKRAFMGGFTHANDLSVGEHFTEEKSGRIDSFDFTSSYPAVMISEMFCMSKADHVKNVTIEGFRKILEEKLSIFDIRFNNIRAKKGVPENYLSVSKCSGENIVENNGRVKSAKWVFTTITNIDFEIIRNFYDWDSIQVGEMLVYDKAYLPKPIIEGILELYKAKTELKGVEGEEVDYILKKGMLNACYGCMVTDIIKPVVEFTNDAGWTIEKTDIEEAIDNYNTSKTRFLYYPWGIFVTAYARRNLFMGIMEFGNMSDPDKGSDYIYSDTDSIKCINADKHMDFINFYNKLITDKVTKCLEFYGIDPSEASPKTIKGVPKPIGVWDWETKDSQYTEFQCLGAKRYMYTQDGIIHITIAGLNKKAGGNFIASQKNPYKFFNDNMYVPKESTGKMLHTYIDSLQEGTIIDYNGLEQEYSEVGGVHLESTSFTLELSKNFRNYLQGIRAQM